MLGLGPSVLPSGTPSSSASTKHPTTTNTMTPTQVLTLAHDLDTEEVANSGVNFLTDRVTGKEVTPIAGPAPEGFQFLPPPGFSANRHFNAVHNIPSGRKKRDAPPSQWYVQELERGRRLGAGIEGDPCKHMLENDDGLGVLDGTMRIANVGWPFEP